MAVVRPNANQFRIMDYGQAVQSGQNILYNRMRNEAAGMELEEAKDMLSRRAKAQEIRSQIDGIPNQIEALDAAGMYEQADALRNNYLSIKLGEVELIKAMREGIDENNYDEVRAGMIQEGSITPGLWPTEYSDDWFRKQAETRASEIKKLTRTWQEDQGAVLSQDLLTRGGDVVWQGQPYQDPSNMPGGKDGDGFEFKASDANAIARATERLFGQWDPVSQRFALLDREQSLKVAAVQEEAERIYSTSQGRVTHGQALAQAARKMNIKIPNISGNEMFDPMNLNFTPSRMNR